MPSLLPRDLSRHISIALNGINEYPGHGHKLLERNRPAPAVIRALETRLAEICGVSVTEMPDPVITELENTFDVMAAPQTANPLNRAKVYLVDLSDLPAWAVVGVLRKFRRGDIGDGRFAPTPAEIRKQVVIIAAHLETERKRIERVLRFWGEQQPVDHIRGAIASVARAMAN